MVRVARVRAVAWTLPPPSRALVRRAVATLLVATVVLGLVVLALAFELASSLPARPGEPPPQAAPGPSDGDARAVAAEVR